MNNGFDNIPDVKDRNIMSTSRSGIKSIKEQLLASNIAGLMILLIVIVVLGIVFTPAMLNKDNIFNVMRSGAILGILGLGMFVVILVGEVDISMGSIMSLSAMLGGMFIRLSESDLIPILATCFFGCLLGVVNGIIVTKFKIDSLISTLGTMLIFSGFAQMTTAGQPILVHNSPIYVWMGKKNLIGLPVSTVFFIILILIMIILMHFSKFSKEFYFTGANSRAAWLSGVDVNKIKIIAFIISGFCAALSGIFLSAQTDQLLPAVGHGYELSGIAIAVIGGTALGGGKGSVIGVILGTVIYQILLNILSLSGLGTYAEQLLKGSLMVIIVITYQIINDRKAKSVIS